LSSPIWRKRLPVRLVSKRKPCTGRASFMQHTSETCGNVYGNDGKNNIELYHPEIRFYLFWGYYTIKTSNCCQTSGLKLDQSTIAGLHSVVAFQVVVV
jgi:hypothetical protein